MASQKFRVTAEDTVVLGKRAGAVVELDPDTCGLNLEALVAGGFLEPAGTPVSKKQEKE